MARFFLLLAIVCFANIHSSLSAADVFCYYDSRSNFRETQGKMIPSDLDPAMTYCTHLVYGYAGIDDKTKKMVSLNERLDLDQGQGNFKAVTQLKRKFPALKVLLSVGGGADKEEEGVYKYNTLIETPVARTTFISSAVVLLKQGGFDGLDLAWQFPKLKPKKVRSGLGSFWHGVKKTFSGDSIVDEKSEEHKEQFSKFIVEVKNALRNEHMMLTASVLPNVNSSLYYDLRTIAPNLDYLIINSYDFSTPERNPKEADYTAPIYELIDRNPEFTVNFQVTNLIRNGFPANKLILGMPAYGRTWNLDSESAISGVPAIHAHKAAPGGQYTKTDGILSYFEVCAMLNDPNNNRKGIHNHLRKVSDPSKRHEYLQHDDTLTKTFGTYAFRTPDDKGEGGIWIGYEDLDTVAEKAAFAKAKGLAGIAIVDLSMDDFRGLCSGDKFPILRAAKFRL